MYPVLVPQAHAHLPCGDHESNPSGVTRAVRKLDGFHSRATLLCSTEGEHARWTCGGLKLTAPHVRSGRSSLVSGCLRGDTCRTCPVTGQCAAGPQSLGHCMLSVSEYQAPDGVGHVGTILAVLDPSCISMTLVLAVGECLNAAGQSLPDIP